MILPAFTTAVVAARENPRLVSERAYDPRDRWASEYYARNIGDVLARYSSYSCQVIGLQEGRKRFIAFRFFPTDFGRTWRDLDSMFVDVCDGGADFWRIEYDLMARRFVFFEPNGDG